MNISIFGLGYVGCVSLGCLAQSGHNMIGVDINEYKVNLINQGVPTIIEKKIDEIINNQNQLKRITATTDYNYAVINSEISIICVGTPSTHEGHLNLSHIYKTAEQIGNSLKKKDTFHTIVIRSTVLPGTNFKFGEIVERISGKKRNIDFSIVSNPEFLREGNAVDDYFNPPVTVIGSDNHKAIGLMESIYKDINGPIEIVDVKIAELIKYVNNSFHALKITFANEVGNICKELDIDSHELMRIFSMDHQLNISEKYLKPGFAYGGSCLPKDLKALNTLAHDFYIDTPVLKAIEPSNEYQKQLVIDNVKNLGKMKIGFWGISFKAGTDDLRYSPSVDLIEKLLGKGYEVAIYDKNVKLSKLIGANRSYVEEKLPHIAELIMDNIDELLSFSEIIIMPNKVETEKYVNSIPPNKIILDLARNEEFISHKNYNGLSW